MYFGPKYHPVMLAEGECVPHRQGHPVSLGVEYRLGWGCHLGTAVDDGMFEPRLTLPFTSEPNAENSALYTMFLAAGQRRTKDIRTGAMSQRLFPNRGLGQREDRRGPSPEAPSICGASSLKLTPTQVTYQTGHVGEKGVIDHSQL